MYLNNLIKNQNFYFRFSILLLVIMFLIQLSACRINKKTEAKEDVLYTCVMHPQIIEKHPGKCPICGMTLVLVQQNNTTQPDEIQLSDQQIQLGNIEVDTLDNGVMGNQTVLTATINYDQQRLTAVSSKLMGRIDRLYHKNIGEYLRTGEPLLELYSEDLNNAKQEYLLALERQKSLDNSVINFDQLITSAKTKLLLWGMNEAQVRALVQSGKASPNTTVLSTASGYITEINVQEGEYINEGGTILQLADLSTLWVEAQVYASQLSQLNSNGNVTVQVPDLGKEFNGKLEFVNPEMSPDKRINLVRVTIPNTGNQLKPGMSAYVILKGAQRKTLSLPSDAIIRDGKGSSVWVQTSRNVFKNKMVTIGMENDDRIEVTGGLGKGEVVVTRGAYLVNSEYIFKKGASPMAGMKM